MDNNFGDSLVTNRKGPEPHDFALLLAVLTAHCARLAMSVISILELASNCYISDIIDIVHHMMDMHHMMVTHYVMDTHHMIFFLAIPKTCISVLRLRDTIRYGVPNQLVLHGISTIVILVSLHLLLHLVDFNCLVRSRFAERETWLDSSHWGSPCSCE